MPSKPSPRIGEVLRLKIAITTILTILLLEYLKYLITGSFQASSSQPRDNIWKTTVIPATLVLTAVLFIVTFDFGRLRCLFIFIAQFFCLSLPSSALLFVVKVLGTICLALLTVLLSGKCAGAFEDFKKTQGQDPGEDGDPIAGTFHNAMSRRRAHSCPPGLSRAASPTVVAIAAASRTSTPEPSRPDHNINNPRATTLPTTTTATAPTPANPPPSSPDPPVQTFRIPNIALSPTPPESPTSTQQSEHRHDGPGPDSNNLRAPSGGGIRSSYPFYRAPVRARVQERAVRRRREEMGRLFGEGDIAGDEACGECGGCT
ncbi:MAG: hypothetical protein M1831_000923 [Alyxoria varia]|nr:MAG: hypothetical protein M1831_000923 [Alyxoria varia]